MTCNTILLIGFGDILILFLGLLLSVCWTIIFLIFKPKLQIISAELIDGEIKIGVMNEGRFHAVNLKLEVCIVNEKFTYHFEIDRQDFLMLPPKKNKYIANTSYKRYFKINDLAKSALKYSDYQTQINSLINSDGDIRLRVRLHANHEYSGFGKAFEQCFKWKNDSLIKI